MKVSKIMWDAYKNELPLLCWAPFHYDFRYKWQREMNDFRGAKYH